MKPRVIIFIYLGGPILHFAKCYSDGYFDQAVCETMQVSHDHIQPQNTEPPFIVDPDNIIVDDSNLGNFIEVTMKAVGGERFSGFMLEARKSDNPTPQGIFSLMDPRSRLLNCDGIDGKAVTQINNQEKTEIKVTWNVSEPGVYFFRATFVKNFGIFWNFKEIPPLPTSTQDPTTVSSTDPGITKTVTILTSTTLSSVTTTAPSQTLLFESSLTLHLLSYLFLAESGPFLIKARMFVWMKVTSIMSFAFSLAAFILLLIDTKQVEGKILAGVVASLNLCQSILIFFLCGPSHELRKIFCWVLRVVAFISFCFTIATIYVGLVEQSSKKPCVYPVVLMGVYSTCHLLSYAFFLYLDLKQKNQRQTASRKKNCRVSCWCTCFVIFSGMNIAFTIALVIGTFCPTIGT